MVGATCKSQSLQHWIKYMLLRSGGGNEHTCECKTCSMCPTCIRTYFLSRGLKVHFNSLGCIVRVNNGEMLAVPSLKSNLHQLDTNVVNGAEMNSFAHSDGNSHFLELWHKRLGHLNVNNVQMLQSMVSGMDVGAAQDDVHSFACEECVEGKQARRPFPTDGGTCATKILELVYSDVCGPIKTSSIGDARYFLTFIDNFSRKIWVYVFKSKKEVLAMFRVSLRLSLLSNARGWHDNKVTSIFWGFFSFLLEISYMRHAVIKIQHELLHRARLQCGDHMLTRGW